MEVCWSPNHEDKFYLFGTNLTLYRISEISSEVPSTKDAIDKVMLTSDTTKASLMCAKTDLQFKCVAWRPDSNPDHLLAIGLNTGKVILFSFGKGSNDSHNLIGKEYALRHPRACIQLEWNPYETHLLAEVTEKQRSDSCILLWDARFSGQSATAASSAMTSSTSCDRKSSSTHHGVGDSSGVSRPILEIGANESCSSMTWFNETPRTFVCGMNGKSLRIFDVRAPTESVRCQASVATKAVNSVTVDKTTQHRIASFFENQLFIWDARKFTEPVTVLQDKLSFSRILWCPTRSGLLACSLQESSSLKLFDFYLPSVSSEDTETLRIERCLKPSSAFSSSSPSDDIISSFDWHPTQRYRLLSVTPSGHVSDFHACDRLPMAWSPDLSLTFCHGTTLNICNTVKLCKEACQDVSVKMCRRALKGYGTKAKLADNLPCVMDDEKLHKIWAWISSVKDEHKFNEAKQFSFTEQFFSTSSSIPVGGPTATSRNTSFARLSLDVNSPVGPHSIPSSLPISPTAAQFSNHHNGYQHQQQQWASASQPTTTAVSTLSSPTEPATWPASPTSPVLPPPLAGVMSTFPRPPQLKQPPISDLVHLDWLMTTSTSSTTSANALIRHRSQVYRSPQRARVVELCGWKFGHDVLSMPLIDKLESEHQYVRAATLSVFTMRMMRAIELLIKGARYKAGASGLSGSQSGGDLNMVAMALSGYTGKEGGLWTNMCSELNQTLENPYLKALFCFLTSEDIGYETIVNDPQLELSDRIAFACLHLPDKKLISLLERQSNKYIEEGDPLGLLLTGLTESGVQLLSNYVDLTGDVQSAVMITMQGQPELELSNNPRVKEWIQAYRDLLDNMKLWAQRAEFDVFYRKFEKVTESFRQTHLSCTFCSKPIVNDLRVIKAKGNTLIGTHMKPRIQSCPHCRKPLARCAICMLYMGTASGIGCPKSTKANLKMDRKLSRISDWFTWCQTCLHGGHVDHIIGWFKSRNQCPVSGCKCKCDQLDMISKIGSGYSTGDCVDDNSVTSDSSTTVMAASIIANNNIGGNSKITNRDGIVVGSNNIDKSNSR